MNLNNIPIFIQVAKNENFSKAAIYLGLTKSRVSKCVSTLEEEIGVKLLHRTTRKVQLTEAGSLYYEQVTKALHLFENAQQIAEEFQQVPKGHLRVRAPMSLGQIHIAPIIPKFLKEYSKISIDLVLSDDQVGLGQIDFDVAIHAGSLPDSTLIARKLSPLKSVLCTSKKYLDKFGQEPLKT